MSATSCTRRSRAAIKTPSRRGSTRFTLGTAQTRALPTTTVGPSPYLPIDPKHVGRSYEAVIRVNSQSGKGGVAYVMHNEHGFDLPRRMQIEFSRTIQHITEDTGTEITPGVMWDTFQTEYLAESPRYTLVGHELHTRSIADSETREGSTKITAQIVVDGEHHTVVGHGSGPISALVRGLREELGVALDVVDYAEHALAVGAGRHSAEARAAAYVETIGDGDEPRWGIGIDADITTAGLKAVLSALERQQR